MAYNLYTYRAEILRERERNRYIYIAVPREHFQFICAGAAFNKLQLTGGRRGDWQGGEVGAA